MGEDHNKATKNERGPDVKARHVFFAAIVLGAATLALAAFRPPLRAEADAAPGPACEGCTFEGPPSPGGFWVTTVLSGRGYDFGLMPGASVGPGGRWSAEFGTIDQEGRYAAPRAVPPGGLDTVRYEWQGAVASVYLRLEEDPQLGFQSPPTVPDGFFEESDFRYPPFWSDPKGMGIGRVPSQEQREEFARRQWTSRDWIEQNIPDDGKWHQVRRSTDPAEADLAPVTDCAQTGLSSAGLIPVSTYFGVHERLTEIGLQPDSEGVQQKSPRRCKTGPINPVPDWNLGDCSPPNATKKVYGPVKHYKKPGPLTAAGEALVDGGLKSKIKILSDIDLTVGIQYIVSRRVIDHYQFQTVDRYRCVGDKWRYVDTLVCDRFGQGSITTPRWANFVFGEPINGDPATWTSWNCNPIP